MNNYLKFSTIICSTLITVSLSQGADINLDKPRFKAGDCLIWTSPTSETPSVVRIKTLHTLTLMGQTARVYEIEFKDGPLSIQTWQFDVGHARKFNCSNFDKVKSEVAAKNKALEDLKELQARPAKEAKQEIYEINKEYNRRVREIERSSVQCTLARMNNHRHEEAEEEYHNCVARTVTDESNLRKEQQERYALLRPKYPSLKIKMQSFSIYLEEED